MVRDQSQPEEVSSRVNSKQFILVDDCNPISITPIQRVTLTKTNHNQGKYINPTTTECTLNTIPKMVPEFDEYGVINSDDEIDKDFQPIGKDKDDEVSEQFIRAFSPVNDGLEEDVL